MNTKDQASGDSEEAVREALIECAERVEVYLCGPNDISREFRHRAAALRHSQPSVQVEGVADLAEKLFAEMCPGIPYLAEDRGWYEDLARAVTKLSPTPATPDHAAVVEALRAPLHELQADVDYLLGRVAVDGSSMSMVSATIKKKLAAIEAALSTMSKAPQAGGDDVACVHPIHQGFSTRDARWYCFGCRKKVDRPSSRAEPVAWPRPWRTVQGGTEICDARGYFVASTLQGQSLDTSEARKRADEIVVIANALSASPPSSRAEVVEECAKLIESGAGMADLIDQELLDLQASKLRALAQPAVGRDGTIASEQVGES